MAGATLALLAALAIAGCGGGDEAEAPAATAAPTASTATVLAAPTPTVEQAALLVPAGADPAVRPDFSGVPAVTPPATHWVNNVIGDDNRSTPTASAPWKTIRKAIASAPAGAVIHVQNSGTPYREHVQLARAGTRAAPFQLIGVAHGGNTGLPEWRDVAGSTQPQLRFDASHWIVKGFIFDKRDSSYNGCVRMASGSSHNVLLELQCRNAHGAPGAHGIIVGGTDQLVRKSKSYDNVAGSCQPNGNCDIHGFLVPAGAKRVVLEQNEAWNNSGDGFQCSGSEVDVRLIDPEDVWVEDGRFHGNHEQSVDIKSCRRVTIAGTRVDGSKFFDQMRGGAMVVHYNAKNILIENTRFWGNLHGIAVGRDGWDVENVVIRRNVFFDFSNPSANRNEGWAVRLFKVKNVDIYHNTFDNIPNGGVFVGLGAYTGNTVNASTNVHVWNNIFRNVHAYAIRWNPAYGPGFASSHNIFYRPAGGAVFSINDAPKTFAQWKAPVGNGGSGQDTHGSREQDPRIVADPRVNDYFTRPGSPARNTALDNSGQPRPCAGAEAPPDIGFKESCGVN
jgi:hypothetical protein